MVHGLCERSQVCGIRVYSKMFILQRIIVYSFWPTHILASRLFETTHITVIMSLGSIGIVCCRGMF
jgi:hypothetical protein